MMKVPIPVPRSCFPLVVLASLNPVPAAAAQALTSEPVYPADLDAPTLARLVDSHLAAARAAVERLVAVIGGRTVPVARVEPLS